MVSSFAPKELDLHLIIDNAPTLTEVKKWLAGRARVSISDWQFLDEGGGAIFFKIFACQHGIGSII